MTPRRATAIALLLALPLAACGDDGESADVTSTTTTTAGADADAVPTVPLDDACALVPDAAEVSGLALGDPAPDGDERRRVCAFPALEEGEVGLTVAVQAGSRFDEKAEQSAEAVGEGEPVDGIGDRALFFFSDEDLPEGVGGLLVAVGDLTLEVTLQGIDEPTMREAAVAIGEAAVARL